MSKKKKNCKPTNRELRRARERAGVTVPPELDYPVPLPVKPQPLPSFQTGDIVILNNRVYGRFGEFLEVAERRWVGDKLVGDGVWAYRMNGLCAWYPEYDIKLIEGTPARAAGVDLGEL